MDARSSRDKWAEWVLARSHANDAEQKRRSLEFLGPIRDGVLEKARINPGDVVLDVGAGDGLIAFGALPLVGESGRVIFCEVSEDLLEHCRVAAEELGGGSGRVRESRRRGPVSDPRCVGQRRDDALGAQLRAE